MRSNLTLRRTYTDRPHPEDNDRFWTVLHKGLSVGCVEQTQGPSDEPPHWSWVIHMHAGKFANGVRQATATDGQAATRDACLPAFRKAFERYRTFIGGEGWASHVEHMRRLERPPAGRSDTDPQTRNR